MMHIVFGAIKNKTVKEKTIMEQYFTFDRITLITSLMTRYSITAVEAAELASDILG